MYEKGGRELLLTKFKIYPSVSLPQQNYHHPGYVAKLDMTWSYPRVLRQRRPPSTSYLECLKSIWDLHDETISIWTHLIAFAVFFAVGVSVSTRRRRKRTDETCANNLYFPAAALIFLCSTLYHTFANHDNATFWRCLDHCSITAFIWASSRSFTLLAYGSKRNTPQLYTAILTSGAVSLVLWNLYSLNAWNGPARISDVSHAVYGAFAALPAFNRPSSLKWRAARARKSLFGSFQALIWVSTLGALLHTTRLVEWMTEESWGSVDHHAMHMAVVVGACAYGREVLCSDLVG
jgi:predicted membrane channel-forming protein YqfA (hemolysin III family)